VKLADKIATCATCREPAAEMAAQRQREYFEWAKRVVDGLRGVHPELEAMFDEAYSHRP
jgi:guanosine-3',5'-bis(diphosphate) 3'-pyrophosphohydrolase